MIAQCPDKHSKKWRRCPSIEREMIAGFGLTVGKLVLSGQIDEVVITISTDIRHL